MKETLSLIQPILVRNLIRYFNDQIDLKWAIIYGTIICLNMTKSYLVVHSYFYKISRIGMQMRIAVCGLIYRKVFIS